jgi:hypothetical protein
MAATQKSRALQVELEARNRAQRQFKNVEGFTAMLKTLRDTEKALRLDPVQNKTEFHVADCLLRYVAKFGHLVPGMMRMTPSVFRPDAHDQLTQTATINDYSENGSARRSQSLAPCARTSLVGLLPQADVAEVSEDIIGYMIESNILELTISDVVVQHFRSPSHKARWWMSNLFDKAMMLSKPMTTDPT